MHGVGLLLAEQGFCDAPLVDLPDGPFLGQVDQLFQRSFESLTTLHPLCFVRVVRQENLAVRDVLIDLVLAVRALDFGGNFAQLIAEAKEVSDILRDYGNGKTIERSVGLRVCSRTKSCETHSLVASIWNVEFVMETDSLLIIYLIKLSRYVFKSPSTLST